MMFIEFLFGMQLLYWILKWERVTIGLYVCDIDKF